MHQANIYLPTYMDITLGYIKGSRFSAELHSSCKHVIEFYVIVENSGLDAVSVCFIFSL
jgi:hypothetical protein